MSAPSVRSMLALLQKSDTGKIVSAEAAVRLIRD